MSEFYQIVILWSNIFVALIDTWPNKNEWINVCLSFCLTFDLPPCHDSHRFIRHVPNCFVRLYFQKEMFLIWIAMFAIYLHNLMMHPHIFDVIIVNWMEIHLGEQQLITGNIWHIIPMEVFCIILNRSPKQSSVCNVCASSRQDWNDFFHAILFILSFF